jgi:hypothetical protein
MKLQEAVLCIDCESLYSHSNHCPECGSQVGFPLGRALDRSRSTAALAGIPPARETARRSRKVLKMPARANAQRQQNA